MYDIIYKQDHCDGRAAQGRQLQRDCTVCVFSSPCPILHFILTPSLSFTRKWHGQNNFLNNFIVQNAKTKQNKTKTKTKITINSFSIIANPGLVQLHLQNTKETVSLRRAQ